MNDTQTIIRLAARGDGVTEEGRFVPGATIGDRVSFVGDSVTIDPGSRHLRPPCPHFSDCGGCQMQHVTDEDYCAFVVDRIARVLGPLMPAGDDVLPVALSPARSRRRASLRATRRGGALALGFNAEGSHRTVDIHQCEILLPSLFALFAPLRDVLGKMVASGQGAGLTLTDSDTGIDLLIANVEAERLDDIQRLTRFAGEAGLARLSVEGAGGVETIYEAETPELTMGGVRVALPPAPFLQPTREGEAALVAAVREAVGNAESVADLFCGLGTFALPLSRTARVTAADAAGPAVQMLTAAARAAGRPLTTSHRDLFRRPLTHDELKLFDAVVFDPPRAGAEAQARLLAHSDVTRIIAVSCNPSTFGRDARLLAEGGWRIRRLWPVAQFRWSSHVELVALFERS